MMKVLTRSQWNLIQDICEAHSQCKKCMKLQIKILIDELHERYEQVRQARIIIQGLLDALADKEQGVVYGKDIVMLLEEAREWVVENT